MRLPPEVAPSLPDSPPVLFDIFDPWGHRVWSGATRNKTCGFFTRAWTDGAYKIRIGESPQQEFHVDTAYFDSIQARAGLMQRTIDAKRDADGLPPKDWAGASNLLQPIVTLHLWREPKQVVDGHMTFCEQRLGFKTAATSARMLGTGAANVPGYVGPYRPLARERSMMFMPPNAVFDFADFAIRKLQRWGYSAKDIEHLVLEQGPGNAPQGGGSGRAGRRGVER